MQTATFRIQYLLLVIMMMCLLHLQCHAQVAKDSAWITTSEGCKIHNPHPVKNESVTWTGKCVGGFANGEGTLTWHKPGKTNAQYSGEMKKGIPHGKGHYIFENGEEQGIYVNGDLHGFGKTVLKHKGKVYYAYQGEYKNDAPSGYGEQVFLHENGDTSSLYKGQFLEDEMHGEGEKKVYAGNYVVVYKGTFVKGELVGTVAIDEWYKGEVMRYNGEFQDGARNGYGESCSGLNRYTGNWKEDRRVGNGKLFLDSMLIYDGTWHNNKFNGQGKRFFFDGSCYSGEFKENQRHGVGTQSWNDGRRYIGEFKKDLYSGYGYFLKDDKVEACGRWENGKLVLSDTFNKTKALLETRYKGKIQQPGARVN